MGFFLFLSYNIVGFLRERMIMFKVDGLSEDLNEIYVTVKGLHDIHNHLNFLLDTIKSKGLSDHFIDLDKTFREIDSGIVSQLKSMASDYGIGESVEDKYNESFINSDLLIAMLKSNPIYVRDMFLRVKSLSESTTDVGAILCMEQDKIAEHNLNIDEIGKAYDLSTLIFRLY